MTTSRLLPTDLTVLDYVRLVSQSAARSSIRSMARRPLEWQAQQLIDSRSSADLTLLTGELEFEARLGAPDSRHAWSLHASDQLVLQSLVAARGVRRAFEIGTFNGGTTRVIAESLPRDGVIWTLDLPAKTFALTQEPENFSGSDVGRAYANSPAAGKVVQLLEDSLTFDVTPYRGQCDLVIVDGAHDYEHGLSDTRKAFELVTPQGVIIWDDFQPYWHGLIRGIYQGASPHIPRRLSGSNLGVWTAVLDGHDVA